MSFAVCVTFQVHLDQVADFLPLMEKNAAQSLKDEPGCERFDVLSDPSRPGEVFLYELYSDAAAFDEHLASAHFKAFDRAVSGMISEKKVATFSEVRS